MSEHQEIPAPAGSASAALADTIVTAIEGRFRDWLMSGDHAEAKKLVAEILDRELDGWLVKAAHLRPTATRTLRQVE